MTDPGTSGLREILMTHAQTFEVDMSFVRLKAARRRARIRMGSGLTMGLVAGSLALVTISSGQRSPSGPSVASPQQSTTPLPSTQPSALTARGCASSIAALHPSRAFDPTADLVEARVSPVAGEASGASTASVVRGFRHEALPASSRLSLSSKTVGPGSYLLAVKAGIADDPFEDTRLIFVSPSELRAQCLAPDGSIVATSATNLPLDLVLQVLQ
jgi:hypothetical protein